MASCPVFDDLIYFTVMSPFRMFSVFIIADSEELLPIDESVLDGLLSSLQKQLGTDDITFYYSIPVKYRNILTQIDSANKCIGNNISGRTGLIKTNGTHEAAVVSANPSANIDHWNALLKMCIRDRGGSVQIRNIPKIPRLITVGNPDGRKFRQIFGQKIL